MAVLERGKRLPRSRNNYPSCPGNYSTIFAMRADSGGSRPPFRDDVARLDGASAGPIRVRSFGFCTGERMPAERTTMRHVREVLRLTTAGVGLNEIARRVGVAPSTIRLTLKRLARAGLSWPLPGEMTDTALETALFAAAGTKQGHRRHAEPDWAQIHRELKRKYVTLTIDRKSTRLNSSHSQISYAVFCLKKK